MVLLRSPTDRLLQRLCERDEDGWRISEIDPSSSGDAMYHSIGRGDSGVAVASGRVRAEASSVVAEFLGVEQRVPVCDGYFIAAWWDVPYAAQLPDVVRYVSSAETSTPEAPIGQSEVPRA